MRRLLALLMIVPFAAILVLSCDEHPTAPESAQAATTVQETSLPQATKAPPLPTPVVLAGAEVITGPYAYTSDIGATVYSYATCPDGKIPLSGGYMVNTNPGTEDFLVMQNAARRSALTTGWSTGIKLTAGNFLGISAFAVCVSAVVTLD